MQEFNKGVYDYIIATDEGDFKSEQDTDDELDEEELEGMQTITMLYFLMSIS